MLPFLPSEKLSQADLKTAFGICECKSCTYKKQALPKPTKKTLRRFVLIRPGFCGGTVSAMNQSDARSQFKKLSNLKSTAKLELEELKR